LAHPCMSSWVKMPLLRYLFLSLLQYFPHAFSLLLRSKWVVYSILLFHSSVDQGSSGCGKVKPDVEVKTMQQLDLHSLGFDPSCSFSKHLESRHCMFNNMCIIRCFDLDYWILGNRWLLLLQALAAQMSRIAVLAAVYDYWKSKVVFLFPLVVHCLCSIQ